MKEIWKPVKGYNNYWVSNLGRVKSRYRIRKRVKRDRGYQVNLSKDGVCTNKMVHILMMESFCGYNNTPDTVVLFKDGNKYNTKLDNLYVDTTENMGRQLGLGYGGREPLTEKIYPDDIGWKEIPGFGYYLANKDGEIWSLKLGKKLNPAKTPQGYLRTIIVDDTGNKRNKGVHQLVALAFLGLPPEDKPNVCHLNHNKQDNRAENLEYGSVQDNVLQSMEVGIHPYWNLTGCEKYAPNM